jgi:hypothetical protein
MKLLKEHYSEYILTSDQSDAVSQIQDFLDNDDKVFLLKGYAGSGKTTLLLGLVRYLKASKRSFQLMAPTGRAAKIIRDKTEEEATTIHKGIYSFEDLEEIEENEKEKGSTFLYHFKLRVENDVRNKVYIIDEASMVSNHLSQGEFFRFGSGHLLNDLFVYSWINKPELNTKVIFVGDPAQLPPVGMNFSPALSELYLKEKFNLQPRAIELKEVKRQSSENGILHSASRIRKSLTSGYFNDFDVTANGVDRFELEYSSLFDTYFALPSPKQIITYKNKTATDFNKRIRQLKYGADVILQKGDLIISGSNNYKANILNGEFAIVSEVTPQLIHREVIFRRKGGEVITVKLAWRYVKLIGEDKRLIEGYILNNYLESDDPYPHPDEMRALYVDFKNRNSSLKPGTTEFKEAIKSDLYFNCILLKYGYAVTCHKAQGGEWDRTIVIWDKGDENKNIEEADTSRKNKSNADFYRWAYTAVTRASKQLYSLNPPRFDSYSSLNFIDPVIDAAYQQLTGNSLQTVEIEIDSELEGEMRNYGLFEAPLELQDHYIKTKYNLSKKLIQIVRWEKKSYEIWYFMQRENETCALKFWINGKNEFKETYAYIPSGTNSESLLNEVNSILKNPSLVNVKHNTSATVLTRLEFEWAVEEKFPFLKKLFDDLQLEFDKLKIHIESLEHKEYKDRYSISREGESLTFDVEYNKDGFFGRVLILPKKTYPRMLIEDLRNTCLKLKNHGV